MNNQFLKYFIRKTLNEAEAKPRVVVYSAVVIEDQNEINKIEQLAAQYVPQGWVKPAHYHMTIGHGKFPDSLRNRGDLNKPVELTITMIGISDKAVAFGTYGYYSRNEMPHITLAVNPANGGRPKASKDIRDWEPINKIKVSGVIREVGEGNTVLSEVEEELPSTAQNMKNSAGSTPIGTSFMGWAGPPAVFPQAGSYDQFGNNWDDIAR